MIGGLPPSTGLPGGRGGFKPHDAVVSEVHHVQLAPGAFDHVGGAEERVCDLTQVPASIREDLHTVVLEVGYIHGLS